MSNIRQRLTPSKIKFNDHHPDLPPKINSCANHLNKKAKYHVLKDSTL